MTPRRKQRLILIGLLVTGVSLAVGIALVSLQQNINLFFSPSQIVRGEVPPGATFRIGGMVVDGSVVRDSSGLGVEFDLSDTAENVTVRFIGILPDLFREGQGIVATGKLENGQFVAHEVLAKHDETYMPPEVSEALKNANASHYGSPSS
ncbi:MAG: cytochrome c maturation protein CcmE [Pseudomonadota bacterium]